MVTVSSDMGVSGGTDWTLIRFGWDDGLIIPATVSQTGERDIIAFSDQHTSFRYSPWLPMLSPDSLSQIMAGTIMSGT